MFGPNKDRQTKKGGWKKKAHFQKSFSSKPSLNDWKKNILLSDACHLARELHCTAYEFQLGFILWPN